MKFLLIKKMRANKTGVIRNPLFFFFFLVVQRNEPRSSCLLRQVPYQIGSHTFARPVSNHQFVFR
jgi:hypothetical protein